MRVQFDDVVVDTESRTVTIAGRPVSLSPRAFATLRVLIEHVDRPVSRSQLMQAVWPDTHVVSNSVSQAVFAVRRALAGTEAVNRILTLPGRGYSFVGPVESRRAPAASEMADKPLGLVESRSRFWRAAVRLACVALVVVEAGFHPEPRASRQPAQMNVSVNDAAGELLATRRAPDLRQAAALFSRAISENPSDAAAFVGLAQAHYLLGFYGLEDAERAGAQARKAASQAIALDPRLSRAYLIRGSVALDTQWDLTASANDFRRAIRLSPEDPLVQHWSAWWCLAAYLMPEARAAMNRAVQLDPFSAATMTARATFAYLDGDFDHARADSERALQLDPRFFRGYLRLGLTELATGRTTQALSALETAHTMAPDVPETVSALAHAYAVTGHRQKAEQLFAQSRADLPPYDQAIVLTGLGQYLNSVNALLTARRQGRLIAGLFAVEPRLAPLHALPGFRQLVAGIAVPPWTTSFFSIQRTGSGPAR